MPDNFKVLSVTRRATISHEDAIEWQVLAAEAREPDAYHPHRYRPATTPSLTWILFSLSPSLTLTHPHSLLSLAKIGEPAPHPPLSPRPYSVLPSCDNLNPWNPCASTPCEASSCPLAASSDFAFLIVDF